MLDVRRHFRENAPDHDAVEFELAKLRDQHFLRDFRNAPPEDARGQRAVLQIAKDDRLPFAADHVHGRFDAEAESAVIPIGS